MKAPYTFDGPYAHCYANRAMAMDERHVFILHEILRAWPFQNALELGSFWGASSTAFIEAINRGMKMIATFCDINLTPGLIDVLDNCLHENQYRVTCEKSSNVLESGETFDFVLVDAGHTIADVAPELERLVIRQPLCVMAHDTNATNAGYKHAEGAKLLADTFRKMPGYLTLEDCQKRENEQTDRGLFFATSEPSLYAIAKQIFSEYAS